MEITRRPARTGIGLALTAAAVAAAALATVSATAAVLAVLGMVGTAAGLVRGERRWLLAGTAIIGLGLLFGGFAGGGPEPLLVAAVGVALTWDLGEQAIGVGEQLGRESDTARVETVHAAASLMVGVVGVTISFGIYSAATGGQPLVALVFLLLGVVALVAALRD